MMDPIITAPMLTSALTKLLDSAAGAAGPQAWAALKRVVAKHRGSEPAKPQSAQEAADLAQHLASEAERDPELARGLTEWHQSVSYSGNTTNDVSGTVHGNVLQARDISGPINFN